MSTSENPGAAGVRLLDDAEVPDVVDVLCESFRDYPVMTHVLGREEGDYERRLKTLVGLFVMARVLREETLLGIGPSGALSAAAIVSRPGGAKNPETLSRLRDAVWEELGAGPRARYEAFGAATAGFDVGRPHIHLNMIGVRDAAQGRGLGRRLLEHVHALSAADPTSTGVTLTTESEANVPLYEHFGYRVVGRARVAPDLETWGFYRADD